MPNVEISKYQAILYAGDRLNQTRVTVLLFNEWQNTIGHLFFVDDEAKLPPNEAAGVTRGFYHMREYGAAMDLLRNERPVYLKTSGKTDVSISTRMEPIGDGDKAAARLFPLW